MGYFFTLKRSRKIIYIRSLVASVLFIIFGLLFMHNWFSYASNKNAYMRYKFPDIRLYYKNGTKFNKKDFIGKITILDFWHKSCGLCFKQFPKVDNFYKSLDTNGIKLFAVNIPIYDTINERKILDETNYTFNKLSLGQTISVITEELRIRGVPIILVIDPEGFVCYEGAFFDDHYIFINNINNILNKIKKKYR